LKSPLEVLREANKRRLRGVKETPLDLLIMLNREKRRHEATKKIFERM